MHWQIHREQTQPCDAFAHLSVETAMTRVNGCAMNSSTNALLREHVSLLDAARLAVAEKDLGRADRLFRDYLANARGDAFGHLDYGRFCARTGRSASAAYLLHRAGALRPGDIEILNELGYVQLETGDVAAARTSFERVVWRKPDHAHANYGLAMCLRAQGEWSLAVDALSRSHAALPDVLPIRLQLADASYRLGDTQAARSHYEAARMVAPSDPALLLALATFFRETGERAQALAVIEACAGQLADEPAVILEKARCLRANGAVGDALRCLESGTLEIRGSPEFLEELGNCRIHSGDQHAGEWCWLRAVSLKIASRQPEAARKLLERTIEINRGNTAAWNFLGVVESAGNHFEAAEAAYSRAIACDERNLDASANLAVLLERCNRLESARQVAEKGLDFAGPTAAQGSSVELLLVLARIARRQHDAGRATALLDQLDTCQRSEGQRIRAAFERGKLLEQQDDFAMAMSAFEQANSIALAGWRRSHPGRNLYRLGIEHVSERVNDGMMDAWMPPRRSPKFEKLAFLVGFPRSGTTLLNQILYCHSRVQTLEEKPAVEMVMDAVRSMPGGYPDCMADFDTFDVDYLREIYFRQASEHGATDRSRLLIDKYPLHINQAGLLHRLFPEARFIFAIRHPCDVVLSCFMQAFELNPAMANFCSLNDTVALYARTMSLWDSYRRKLDLAVHDIRYEDLVEDFDAELGRICTFLDLSIEPEMREFSQHALRRGPIDTPSYDQVSQPIYKRSCNRWQNYREYLQPHLSVLQPYIDRFGYRI
jgi:tetratricopeptide (TPR) repeat protein